MVLQRPGDVQGSELSGMRSTCLLGFKEPLVLILGQPPSGGGPPRDGPRRYYRLVGEQYAGHRWRTESNMDRR
jgi:hypothetical protein